MQSSQPPSSSLSVPIGTESNPSILPSQTTINIPRPNIDLSESPQTPIDDPLNHVLTPPQNDDSDGSASLSFQTPNVDSKQTSVSQDLIPPEIPSEGPGIKIPRPNLDAGETPIDNSNGPLNQGLLPPTDGSIIKDSPPSLPAPSFSNPNQDGPVVITEVHFAPKPSNGLLPPKDASPNDINYQSPDTQSDFQPTVPTTNKFSFGGSPGILGQAAEKFAGAVDTVQNKFTGSFGGAPGVLGGRGPGASRPSSTVNQIPVVVVQSPPFNPPPRASPASPTTQAFASQAPKAVVDKYQGSFGGSSGVLGKKNKL